MLGFWFCVWEQCIERRAMLPSFFQCIYLGYMVYKQILQHPSSGVMFPIKSKAATAARAPRTRHTRQLVPPSLFHRRRSHVLMSVELAATAATTTVDINILLPIHRIAETPYTRPPSFVRTSRAPSPPGALRHGQMVPAEREKGTDGAHDKTKQDVEPVVAEVEPS